MVEQVIPAPQRLPLETVAERAYAASLAKLRKFSPDGLEVPQIEGAMLQVWRDVVFAVISATQEKDQ